MMDSKLTQQHVFIIGDGTLLSEGVTEILKHEPDLIISSATYSDHPPFLDMAEWTLPDAILVCDSGLVELAHIFNILSSQRLVLSLFIIIIRLSTNKIDCYANASFVEGEIFGKRKEIVTMTRLDLVNILKRDYRK
jgi:hypothetical protein